MSNYLPLATLERLKSWLSISVTTYDVVLTSTLDAVKSDAVLEWDVAADEGAENVLQAVIEVAASKYKSRERIGVTSRGADGTHVNYEAPALLGDYACIRNARSIAFA